VLPTTSHVQAKLKKRESSSKTTHSSSVAIGPLPLSKYSPLKRRNEIYMARFSRKFFLSFVFLVCPFWGKGRNGNERKIFALRNQSFKMQVW
jgi:hypothetical protein